MILSALLRFSEQIHSVETFIYNVSEVSKLFTHFLNRLFALNNGKKDSNFLKIDVKTSLFS